MASVRTGLVVFFAVLLGLSFLPDESRAKCRKVVPRLAWNAEPATFVLEAKQIPDVVVLHQSAYNGNCTDFETCSNVMRLMQFKDIHIRHISDIIYNFCIGTDYKIYEGRGWGYVGRHAKYLNSRSIGICIIDDPDSFSPTMENALKSFLQCAEERNYLQKNYKVVGHRLVADRL